MVYLTADWDILSAVIDMRKYESIKTRLYFAFSVLLLTTVCIIVYTSMRSNGSDGIQNPAAAREQSKTAENEPVELQQVSSINASENAAQQAQDTDATTDAGEYVKEQAEVTYTLVVTNGYLQAYVVETGTPYMDTTIAFDLLPENVQQQIAEGKYFESEEALLGFLESYSS